MSNRYAKYLKRLGAVMNDKTINILKAPEKEINKAHYPIYELNIKQQMDLLEMPKDSEGYHFLLVIIDFKRHVEAVPLKNKSRDNVLKAIKQIYENSTLKPPMSIQHDAGTEFNNVVVRKYYTDNYTVVKIGKPGRHRQQALVENFNKIFGTLYAIMTNQAELKTHVEIKEWREYVPQIVEAYNDENAGRLTKYTKWIDKKPYPVTKGINAELLMEGDVVRIPLEKPIKAHNREVNHNKWRAGDIRFQPKNYKIDKLILHHRQPPLYEVKQHRKVFYTREQLQKVDPNENDDMKPKPEKLIDGFYVAEKFTDKRLNPVSYLVKWKRHKRQTWETEKKLKDDLGITNFNILKADYLDNLP